MANMRPDVPETPARGFIRHVVFFNAKDIGDLDVIIEGLSMLAQISHARLFEVSKNRHVDSFSDEVEVVVYAEFNSQTDLTAYKNHPTYQASIDAVRPLRDLRIAADF
ncbi:MAG: Dabb family protein [Sulfitobacter sp.]